MSHQTIKPVTTNTMLRAIIDLEIKLGVHRPFEYSNNEEVKRDQMEQALRSLEYIEQMRKDNKTRMEHFTKPLFPKLSKWMSTIMNNESDDEDEVDKVQVAGYNKLDPVR